MKTFYLTLLLVLMMLKVFPSSASTIDLAGTWLFKTGDNPEWAQVECVDSAWDFISAPQIWESAGFSKYNGFAWYRKSVVIPKSWQHEKYFQIKKYLLLDLGIIDDTDQVFFNGESIGTTGVFPPAFQSKWTESRHYQVPANLIHWGEANLIAVRVFDRDGNGGIYSGQLSLKTPSLIDYCEIQTTLNRLDHLFHIGDILIATTSIKNESFDKLIGTIEWKMYTDFGVPKQTITQNIELPVGGFSTLKARFRYPGTGVYRIVIRLLFDYDIVYESTQTLVYALGKLKAKPLSIRNDFESFWKRTLNQLKLIPILPQINPIDTLSSAFREYCSVQLLSFDNTNIYGIYSLPLSNKKLPVIIAILEDTLQSTRPLEELFPDFAIFSINIRGFGRSRKEIDPGFPGYVVWNIDNKEKYICRGAIMDCIRSMDFLCSRSEIDTSRIAFIGTGLTGGLSLAAAALDHRIKLSAVFAPLMLDFQTATKTASVSYHEIVRYIVEHPAEKELVFQNLSYFDLINFAPQMQNPVFLGSDLENIFVPARTVAVFYNAIPSPKQLNWYKNSCINTFDIKHLKEFKAWLMKTWEAQNNSRVTN